MFYLPRLGALSIVGVFVLIPFVASAKLQISEVMYDVSGSDSDREWIEILNDGEVATDLSLYKLFESGTNHRINAVSGGSSLAPHTVGVIVQDRQKFLADNPHFIGVIFTSTFSLSNEGETFSLRNGNLETESSVTYSASLGAKGDGQSLHRVSEANFKAGDSHPGTYPEPADIPRPTTPLTKVEASKTKTDVVKKSAPAAIQAAPREDQQIAPDLESNITLGKKTSKSSTWWIYALGAAALSILGAGIVLLLRSDQSHIEFQSLKEKAGSFEIIE